jgi:cell division protein FtsW (lipid II flippase)
VSLFGTPHASFIDNRQSRLLHFAALFLLLYGIAQTLSPAARLHSWEVVYRWNHWIGFGVWLVCTMLVNRQLARRLPDRDPFLFPVLALLAGWGLMVIWRLDATMGARQTMWLAVSMGVFALGLQTTQLLAFLRRYKTIWLTLGLLLTALTFLFGTYPGGYGPHLWLGCCGLYLQPSEPLKLLLIIYLAAYLADRMPVTFGLVQLLTPTLILAGVALALLVIQRDLGTASLFIMIYTVVVYLASNRWRLLIGSLAILATAGVVGYTLFDVVRIRVDAWLNPWLDPIGRSYQVVQSLMAVAAGDLFGRGPGLGSPGVVPVAHSDFIFAAIAEETGMFGITGLLLLFALLVARGFLAAMQSPNNYQRYLAAGITSYLVIQAILIIGGNLRLLPLTGVTLPFVSYGGSSLLTVFFAGLLLVIVSSQGDEAPAPLPRPLPYYLVSGLLLAGLFALALVSGWWAFVRSEAILNRTDNPRRSINERFVQRGALLDRSNNLIVHTTGQPGGYTRQYVHPPLSATTGYNSPLYGQTGLEAGMDSFLRGLEGNPEALIYSHHLLYGQPPPGVPVRLSIDLELQEQADQLMEGRKGALVLINSSTGEILVMASHPYFNPNQLEENWADLIQDADAPLINRATQGRYPPGPALGPFLLAFARAMNQEPAFTTQRSFASDNGEWDCALTPETPPTPGRLISAGCPGPSITIGRSMGAPELERLFESLRFFSAPSLPLQMAPPAPRAIQNVDLAAIGQENLSVTPLQMALAAAALNNQGLQPTPQLAMGVLAVEQQLVLFPGSQLQATALGTNTEPTLQDLTPSGALYWRTAATALSSDDRTITWYLSGTLPGWQGAPLALALVLEEDNPQLAEQIGQAVMQDAHD